jgi:hypothetical protein
VKTPFCPYCKNDAVLCDSAVVYNGTSYGLIWRCAPCEAWVGVHRDSPNHAPLGRLANKELRLAKQAAHRAFDPFWKGGTMKRSQAYQWLADQMGIEKKRCHIGWFDVEQCEQVVKICEKVTQLMEGFETWSHLKTQ